MSYLLRLISFLALLATIVPPVLFWADQLDQASMRNIMFAATLVWFVVTPLWMDRAEKKNRQDADR